MMMDFVVEHEFILPDDSQLFYYHKEALNLAKSIAGHIEIPWQIKLQPPPGDYNFSFEYASAVEEFINQALLDPNWKGDGLGFDRVSHHG